ncbi:MAG TPA: PTS sugar transporter subunit IIA [Myxococcota bacterium]|nr:PTS sugar transporter subunit IIA [Myxococcota bacterium]
MHLRDYLDPDMVMTDLTPANDRELISSLADHICSRRLELNREDVFQGLWERELKMCTGLEGGIAIPHAMIAGLKKPVCFVGRLTEPLDMGTQDGIPVQIVFCLLSPAGQVGTHIRILARIARFCSIRPFLERMQQATDAAALYSIVAAEDDKHV